uniref:Uncharacterized protein n=1 Tax=Lobelia spicata TaxID=1441989 RepID=A0A291F0F8_9ASTR|nr:hypothetical protein Lo_spi1Pt0803 [Lobelia spicata]ATG25618.1 hypothetical protein Lo_spi1Pt0803 [Lobelia spicata]
MLEKIDMVGKSFVRGVFCGLYSRFFSAELQRKSKCHCSPNGGPLPSENSEEPLGSTTPSENSEEPLGSTTPSENSEDPFLALCKSQAWSDSQKLKLLKLLLFLRGFRTHPQKNQCRRMICEGFAEWIRGSANDDAFVDLCLSRDWSELQLERLVSLCGRLKTFNKIDNPTHRAEFRRMFCKNFAEIESFREFLELNYNSDSDD